MSIKYRNTYAQMRQGNWTDLKVNVFNEEDDAYLACVHLGEAIVTGLGEYEVLQGGASMPEEAKKAWLYNAAVLERHARMIRDYVAMAEGSDEDEIIWQRYYDYLVKRGASAAELAEWEQRKPGQEASVLMKEGAKDE